MSGNSEIISKTPGKNSTKRNYGINVKKFCKGVVSGIDTKKALKNVWNGFALLILSSAFVYQIMVFFNHVYEYPTVLNIDIIKPEAILAPGIVFCTNSRYNRDKFCQTYPDYCVSTDAEFCKLHKDYCEITNIRVKEEHYTNLRSPEFKYNITHTLAEGTFEYGVEAYYSYKLFEDRSDCILLVPIAENRDGLKYLRQTKEDLFHSSKQHDASKWGRLLYLHFEPPEILDLHNPLETYFAVNSQFDEEIDLETESLQYLKPGMRYKILIETKEERRLPHPYKTNCTDYIKLWRENGKTGPLSRELCVTDCYKRMFSIFDECFGVIYLDDESKAKCNFRKGLEKCTAGCTQDCVETSYTVAVKERTASFVNKHGTTVEVYMNYAEQVIYEFSQKYEEVEIFSYIGGFLGIWLGVSFVQ
nr:uncharacterized protein LOC107450431 isoform X2 [Parasteatoda tepidariorum]